MMGPPYGGDPWIVVIEISSTCNLIKKNAAIINYYTIILSSKLIEHSII